MKPLDVQFTSEVDEVDQNDWARILAGFSDHNIYQTWSYESARRNPASRLVVRRAGHIIAVAQARISRLPVVGAGVAYIRWGPVWRQRGEAANLENLRQMLRAIRNEYAVRRGLLVRLYPRFFDDESDLLLPLLSQEGFMFRKDLGTDRTLLLELEASLGQLRQGLNRKWRNHLNRAERNGLEVVEGDRNDLFDQYLDLHQELVDRKKFADSVDMEEFRLIQKDLPEELKMRVMICKADGKPGAGVVCSALGEMGLYLFGATNRIGMKTRGSYLLQWHTIKWLKEKGIRIYNLHGINPEKNPGTYSFKRGIAGKNGRDVHFLGRFESCNNPLSRRVVRLGESIRSFSNPLRQG